MTPLLSISGFRKQYPSGFQVVIDLLELPKGIHLIQGENGSGKSTFLKALAGIHPVQGTIAVCGISLEKRPLDYRMNVGYAEAEPVFPEFLNLDDLIQVVASAKKSPSGQVEHLKSIFGVDSYSKHPIGTYSSGMLKKSALVLAFLGNPSLIILDEPFTTIDVGSQEVLTEVITESAKSGIGFLLTSHQSNPLDHISIDSRLILENGRLLSHV